MHHAYKIKGNENSKIIIGSLTEKGSYLKKQKNFLGSEIGNKDGRVGHKIQIGKHKEDYNCNRLILNNITRRLKNKCSDDFMQKGWVVKIYNQDRIDLSVEDEFYNAAKTWKKETVIYSFVSRKITNNNYVNIIGLGVVYGEPIIKLILQDLQKGTEFWHYALKKITNDNPVPKGDVNNLQKVRDAWLAWGKEKQMI